MIITNTAHKIYFDWGKFDEYCVYHIDNQGKKTIPKDEHYFKWIKDLADKYDRDKVYNDFLQVYNFASENFDGVNALTLAKKIDDKYEEDTTHWWIIFYMTMVAECKKKNAILKKRIKHLGIYNLLFDNYDIAYIVSYMKGKNWRELDALMKERNI